MNFRLPLPNVFSSIPDFLLGLTFLITWIEPKALGDDMVSSMFQIMLVEFIIIHSAGFMGNVIYSNYPQSKKILYLLGFGLFYFVFIGAFAFSFKSWWPVFAFGGLLLNRMLSVITGQAETGKEQEFVKQMWGVNVGCYLVSVFAAILIPLPEFGVSPNDLSHLNMSGDFVDQPHKMMAWGFMYFMMVGWYEMKLQKKTIPIQERI